MQDGVRVGLAFLIFLQAGYLFLRMVRANCPDFSSLEKGCLAFGLGVGLITAQMLLWSLMGIQLTLLAVSLPWVAGWLILILVKTTTDRFWLQNAIQQRATQLASFRVTFNYIPRSGALLLGLTIAAVFVAASLYPLRDWDSWAIWELKARAFYFQRSILPFVSDPYYALTHLDYPLLYPLSGTLLNLSLGRASDLVLLIPAAFYASLLGVFYANLRRWGGPISVSVGLTLGLAWAPNILFWSQQFYAEMPLLYFVLVSMMYLFAYFRRSNWNLLWVAGVMAGFATQVKTEGVLLIAPAVAALVLRAITTSQARRQHSLVALAFTAPIVLISLPWAVYRTWVAPYTGTLSSDEIVRAWANLSFLPQVGQVYLEWLQPKYQGMFFLLFPATLLLLVLNGWKYLKQWPFNYLLGHTLLMLLPYSLFFLAEPIWLEPVRLGRYLMIVTGACYFLFALQTIEVFQPNEATATSASYPRKAQRIRQGVIGLWVASVLILDFIPDAIGRAHIPIFTNRPATLWRNIGRDAARLGHLSPPQRRQMLEAENGNLVYGKLIQIVLTATPAHENVGIWAIPQTNPTGNYLLQRSFSLLFPRRVFMLDEPAELEADYLNGLGIGAVIVYERELPPGILSGLTLYQTEGQYAIVRTQLSETATLPADGFTSALVEFANGLQLTGYQWVDSLLDSERLLVLNWRATQAIANSYTVFVHVFDADGVLITQHDGLPAWGQAPTPFWQPGHLVVDTHPLMIPENVRPGAQFCIGLYNALTGERLGILGAEVYTVANNTACQSLP